MKYNYLEQYNLINILKEGLGVNFSDFKDIEKSVDINILNPIKDKDMDDLTIEDFNLFISGKKIIQKELNLDIAYLFFYNKLFIVKISGDEIPSIVFSSSSLFSEYKKNNKDNFEDFKEKLETINFESYSNYSRIKHEDSKEFWKYIILCLKIFIKESNINTFQFTGSASTIASKARLRQTNNLLITKQIQNFHTLLYLNLDKISNIDNSFKKIQIKKILKKYKNQLISYFDTLYKPFKIKINNKLESQFAIIRKAIEKQIEINNSFEDKKNLQKLVIKIDDLLDDKDLIIKNIIKINNVIELEKKLPIYNDEKDEKEFDDNEEFDSKEYLKLLNITKDSEDAIIYLNNLNNLKQIKKSLDLYIKQFDNFYKNFADILKELEGKNVFDILYDKKTIIDELEMQLIQTNKIFSMIVLFRTYLTFKSIKIESDSVSALQFIKKIMAISDILIEKYNFYTNTFWNYQNDFLDLFKNILKKNKNSIGYIKQQVTTAMDLTIKEIIDSNDNFKLADDYEYKLKEFIDANFHGNTIQKYVIDSFEDDSLAIFPPFEDYDENEDEFKSQLGYVLNITEKGIMSFLNTREKMYYRALLSYKKFNPDDLDIFYDGSTIYFKIWNA